MNKNTISIDYQKVASAISNKKLLRNLLISTAIATNLLPLFTKDILNKNAKLALALTGCVSALCCCKLPEFDYENKLKKTFEDTELKQFKISLQGEILRNQSELEIFNQQELTKTIESLPDYQIDYFAEKYGVSPLLAANYIEENYEPEAKVISETIGHPSQPTLHIPNIPGSHWIDNLIYEFTLPQGKRLHEHLLINGGTQSGKSTLSSAVIGKIINAYSHQNKGTILNLIDPKYPMTRWLWEPMFTGFESVCEGIEQAIKELEARKFNAKSAKKSDTALPQFTPYLLILDEWDICYGNGKGYGKVICKDDAQSLLASVKRIISEGAAYEMRLILIGQSPLSGDNGLNRSLAKQTTRIVVGQEGLSWLQDPGFPFKKDAGNLIDEIEPLLKAEKRTALICPNKGAVKVFEIPDIQISGEETLSKNEKQDTSDVPVEKHEARIADWCFECFKEFGRYPSDGHLIQAWNEMTKKEITENGLKVLKEILFKAYGLKL